LQEETPRLAAQRGKTVRLWGVAKRSKISGKVEDWISKKKGGSKNKEYKQRRRERGKKPRQ